MYTQCPKCMTYFQVTAEHLKVAQGNVRCGQCRNVFSALGNLSEMPPQGGQTDASGQSTQARPAKAPAGTTQSKLSHAIAAIQALNKSSQKILSDGRKSYIANLNKQSQARKQYSAVNSEDATARDLSQENPDPNAEIFPEITDENEQFVAEDLVEDSGTNINFDEAMKAVDEIEIEDEEDAPIRYGHDDSEDITPAIDATHLVADYAVEESFVSDEDREFEDLEDIAKELEQPVEIKLSPAGKSKNLTPEERERESKERALREANRIKAEQAKARQQQARSITTIVESEPPAKSKPKNDDIESIVSEDEFDFSDLGDNILPPLDEPEPKPEKKPKKDKGKNKTTRQNKKPAKPSTKTPAPPKKEARQQSAKETAKNKPAAKPPAHEPAKSKTAKVKSPPKKPTAAKPATRSNQIKINKSQLPPATGAPPVLEIPKQLLEDFQQTDHVSIWHHKSAMKWGVGSLVMMLLFLVQTVYFKHNELGQISQLRPWIEFFCKHASCELALQSDIGQIELLGQDIRSHPKTKKALLVSATIINNAKFNQPYPGLRLNFSNMNGQKIAVRDFRPEEYLTKEIALDKGMESNTPIQIALEILDPGKNAVNFEFDFFSI